MGKVSETAQGEAEMKGKRTIDIPVSRFSVGFCQIGNEIKSVSLGFELLGSSISLDEDKNGTGCSIFNPQLAVSI